VDFAIVEQVPDLLGLLHGELVHGLAHHVKLLLDVFVRVLLLADLVLLHYVEQPSHIVV